ncbi:carbohydrate ABC transporter permease [Paenibacillus koleovorans]|uniref:carbohydrate ABC transporter permease n=1 Tax=Paenibacillus koleovorans TaxID=121608 RepID=UPI001FE92A56|nr:carbohydrate ABC transporter permease [Paenibacillus koleovorans]
MVTNKKDSLFQWINGLVLLGFSLTMIAPVLHLAAVSLSSPVYAQAKLVYLLPKGLNLDVYRTILGMSQIWRSMAVTILITLAGTFTYIFLTSTIAYGLSRSQSPFRGLILKAILVTFVFNIPLIPNYLWIRTLGMENTLWALIIPSALGAFGVIIMKTFFQGLSSEVFDSAKIDGCSEFGIYLRIAMPLSTAVIATLSLFHAVGVWNSYFYAIIFIRDPSLFPLQVLLRRLVVEDNGSISTIIGDAATQSTPEMMKAGIILFATLPIILVYPFLQKYFVKGAMLGSLKE